MLNALIANRLNVLGLSERKACLSAGVNVDSIRRIRNGFAPKVHTLSALAPVLGVPVERLLRALEGRDLDADAKSTSPAPGDLVIVDGHVTERLRNLRIRAGLSMEAMAAAMGYKTASGYQRYEDAKLFTKKNIPLDKVEALLPILVGEGSPPITREEVMALAIPEKPMQSPEALMPHSERSAQISPELAAIDAAVRAGNLEYADALISLFQAKIRVMRMDGEAK